MTKVSRGRALYYTILVLSLFILVACNKKIEKFEDSRFIFGTYVKIVAFSDDEAKLRKSFDRAFHEMERIDENYNSKNEKSKIYALNNKLTSEIELDEEGQYIFSEVSKMYELSKHKYDITIEPLMELWGFTDEMIDSEKLKLPSEKDIEYVKNFIDFSKVIIKDGKMHYEKPIKGIDTGSFIKGYALEKAKQVLREDGFNNFFISAISSIETSGTKPENKAWKIGLENPEDTEKFIGILNFKGENMGVSGDYQTYVEIDGKKYHHIIDKESGYPVSDKKMVAVITDNGLKADLYSTTFFLMPIEDILKYVESQKDLEVLIVTKDRELIKSSGFKLEEANNK